MNIKEKYKLEYNFLIYLIGKCISAGAILCSVPLFINLFGIASYGKFVFLYTTFLMLFSGASSWINQGILRFFTLEKNKNRLLKEINQLSFNSFLIATAVLVVIFYFFNTSLYIIVTAILSLYFSINYSVNLCIRQSEFASKEFIIADTIRAIVYILTPLVIHYSKLNLDSTFVLFLAVLLSYVFGGLFLSGKLFYKAKLSFKKSRWSTIFLKYGMPLSFWIMFSPTTNVVDRYVIEFTLGSIALAKFSAVFDIVFKLFSNLAVPFNNIVQPMLIKSYNDKNAFEYKKTMIKAIGYISLIFLVFAIAMSLLKEIIICNFLNFCNYQDYISKLFFPLLISSYLWQISILLQKNLEASNRTVEMTIYILLVVVFVAATGFFLVPKYGLIASSYISLASALLYFILILYGTKKYFNL